MTLFDSHAQATGTIIPAAGDGNSFKLLSTQAFPAILLDGTLTTQTLLAEDNQGLLSLSEYAKFCRDMSLKKTTRLMADLQSGFGSPLNTYYAAQELERSGADILLLNDQKYPAHSTKDPATTTPADLIGKLRAAIDGLDNPNTEVWLKLEGIASYGIDGLLKRIHYASNAGADAIVLAHCQPEQLNSILAQQPELPILATYQSSQPAIAGLAGWLDDGYLAMQAQSARETALKTLTKEVFEYAKK